MTENREPYPPPFIEVIIVRDGVRATANVEILDGFVDDHDELGERLAMAAVGIVRQAIISRSAPTPAPPPPAF